MRFLNRHKKLFFLFVLLLPVACTPAPEDLAASQNKLTLTDDGVLLSNSTSYDIFGDAAMAVDGDVILVSDPKERTAGIAGGAVYAFVRGASGWTQEAKLLPDAPRHASYFGRALALDGARAAIARHNEVYIFERNGGNWSQQAVLQPSDGGRGTQFGFSVALHQDTLVVGATHSARCTSNPCLLDRAYVFERTATGWRETAILRASDDPGTTRMGFGWSVNIDAHSGAIAVSAPYYKAVYIFAKGASGWSQSARVGPSGSARFFGSSIALDANTLMIGDEQDDVTRSGGYSGSVSVYQRDSSGWHFQSKLYEAELQGEYGYFGRSLALAGDTALIGAYHLTEPGAAYVYKRTGSTWARVARVSEPGRRFQGSGFGLVVGFSGNTFAVMGIHTNGRTGVKVYSAGLDCANFQLQAFTSPMGKRKKIGATIPVKAALLYRGSTIENQAQLDTILAQNGAPAACPAIRVSSQKGTIPSPGNSQDGNCFRFTDGHLHFNIKLNADRFSPQQSYQVSVQLATCNLTGANDTFHIR